MGVNLSDIMRDGLDIYAALGWRTSDVNGLLGYGHQYQVPLPCQT
jgi:hypothetical protein